MIPNGTAGIENIKTRILENLLPKTEDPYTLADLALISNLVRMVGQDFNRAVDVLMADNADIVAIFEEVEPNIADAALRARMAAARSAKVDGFCVDALNLRADVTMRVLIDVQEAVEAADADGASWAATSLQRIWRFLDAYVARRAYVIEM
jgi:hypothetical protein